MKRGNKIQLDIVIKSRPLTFVEESAISEYIRTYKAKKLKSKDQIKSSEKTGSKKKVLK